MADLSMEKNELGLLNWLSTDDGQYGECSGKSLDALMARGFVEWKRQDQRGKAFGWVGVTDVGREALKIARASCPHPYRAPTLHGGTQCGLCGETEEPGNG
jgi:hypothetical protein